MFETNPIVLVDTLKDTLKRYISTTLPLSRRYPGLQNEFYKLVAKQKLVKGPYVEALPDFEKGVFLKKLLSDNGGFLHNGFSNLPDHILDRKLHLHQEQALIAACKNKKSLIVATGTGSGKTETFLFPIVNSLLKDKTPEKQGVRVLLIYPMNALANDQLFYRIAPLLGRYLKKYDITFGRYTGQIKAYTERREEEYKLKENEKLMQALGNSIPSNWLLTRQEMIDDPPKVLITNYAMLEHLLLLPRNAPLFAHDTLHTIVLDEIHTYSGAQATEVGFLLRKLKNRLGINKHLQVFGTSASLASGTGADEALLDFAGQLFGETVHKVIRGKRIPHYRLSQSHDGFNLSPEEWIEIGEILKESLVEDYDADDWNELIEEKKIGNGRIKVDNGKKLPIALEEVFFKNREVRGVAEILDQGRIFSFEELAKNIFKNENLLEADRNKALSAVMHLGMLASQLPDSFPLLPSRYHIVTNSIEGVCVSLDPNNDEGWNKIKPFRNFTDHKNRPYYPLLVCRSCGQPYIEGFSNKERLFNTLKETDASDRNFSRKVYWLGKRTKSETQDEEDEDKKNDGKKKETHGQLFIDPSTGRFEYSNENGAYLHLYEIETTRDEVERNDYVRKCKACGGLARGSLAEVISHMSVGNEALGAVVTQKVLEALPGKKDLDDPKPMGGRSLLAFSDSRQNAAYFAPYFERTSSELALRTAILRVIKHEGEPVNFEDIAYLIIKDWRKRGQPVVFSSSGEIIESRTRKLDQVIGSVAAEFCTPGGRRNSLEALGLVYVTYEKRKLRKLVKAVRNLLPSTIKDSADSLTHILLETIRRQKAITNLYDVDMKNPFIWGSSYQGHRSFEPYKTNPKIKYAWIPQEGQSRHNRRTWFLVERLHFSWDETRKILGDVWQALEDHRFLRRMHPGFGLDAKLIRFVNGTEHELFYCEDCGLLQFDTINKCCIAFRCEGQTKKLSDGELAQYHRKNHYIFNIENGEAQTTRACEHTASLSTELRQDIEQEFSQNKINLLSCTTTMEMGVDLGELEAIICLNIPPGISNYQQRTGRAGRRAQAAPFCVTTARNSQYDQAVFANFVEYLEQPALVPRIHLENAKLFQRHQNSVMLSGFLRAKIEDHNINAPSIADLFGVEFDAHQYHNFKDAVYNWIESDDGQKYIQEAERLTTTLPDHIREKISLNGYALKEKFAEQLLMLAIEVRERWSLYTDKYKDAYESEKLGVAKHWQNQRAKFMNQFLVTQLSSYGMIPTYSFPVNSLNLDVTKEYSTQRGFWSDKDVSLSRDAMLGIAEYAPGAEVVANGRIWTSQGLAYYPRDFMPTRYYTTCKECHHVEVGEDKADLSNVCSFCGNQSLGMRRAFIEPHGFVTAYKDRKGKDPSLHRIRKQYADEARLISLARDNQFVISDNPVVSKAILRSHSLDPDEPIGTLCIVNRGTFGMGYHHCPFCHYMMPAKKFEYKSKKHVELLGDRQCKRRHLEWPKDMAHTFNTDVCILRFNRQLPILPNNAQKSDPQRYLNAFARTLCEALRYASATVLGLQVDVIRVTYKMSDRRLSVIIYDAVPGGAGYSARLFNESKVNDLLKAAIKRLDCPQNCSSGCRSCLCDYFNQRIWDILDRKPVLEWLQQLVLHNVEHPILRRGAVKWENPNYHGLSERLESYNQIHLAGRTLLTNQSTYDGSAVNWILSELNNGRLINIHLFDGLDIKKINTYQERQILNHLRPFIENGQLVIGKLDISEELDNCLRVIPEPIDGAPVFYTDFPLPAILDQIIPQPAYQLVAHDRLVTDIKDLLHASMPYKTEYFFPPSKKMQRWQLVSGVPRVLTNYFAELKNAYIDNIVIKDPYCCAGESQVKSLHQFIKFLNGQVKELKKITIQCKEQAYNNRNYQRPEEVQTTLKSALNDVLDISPTIKVIPFRYGKNFHDRIIKAITIDNEGVETKHLYDLTGGVDFLMDNNRSTVIFYSQESN